MRPFLTLLAILLWLPGSGSPASAQSDWAICAKAIGDDAIAACERLIKSNSKNGNELAIIHANRCRALNERRDHDSAVIDCSEAIRLNPRNAMAYRQRCWALEVKRELDRALEDCNVAIRLQPEDSVSYNNRCVIWNRKEEYDRGIPDCNEAIRLNPKYTLAYANRCWAWRGKQDFERAMSDCDTAIRLGPKSRFGYSERCVLWNRMNEPDRAITDCDESIRISPQYANPYLNRGIAWSAKGDNERALADYSQAILLNPKYEIAYNRRALLYESTGELEKALADFRTVAVLNPKRATAGERVRRVEQKLAAQTGANSAIVADPKPVVTAANPIPRPTVAAPAASEVRVALVIGNGTYANASAVPNAKSDAEKVAATLQGIGFNTVTLDVNLSRDQIADALKAFSRLADQADWAVVYYAGHGIEFGGVNYLIPTDARLLSDRDVALETLPLDQVLLAVEGARKMRLVVLDACRENPFAATMRRTTASRAVGRGLGRIEPDGATLVVYAAKDGQVALDGEGGNSPFATAFTTHIETPGLEINFLFRKVRDDVLAATRRRQEPYVYGSLPAESFYFRQP